MIYRGGGRQPTGRGSGTRRVRGLSLSAVGWGGGRTKRKGNGRLGGRGIKRARVLRGAQPIQNTLAAGRSGPADSQHTHTHTHTHSESEQDKQHTIQTTPARRGRMGQGANKKAKNRGWGRITDWAKKSQKGARHRWYRTGDGRVAKNGVWLVGPSARGARAGGGPPRPFCVATSRGRAGGGGVMLMRLVGFVCAGLSARGWVGRRIGIGHLANQHTARRRWASEQNLGASSAHRSAAKVAMCGVVQCLLGF